MLADMLLLCPIGTAARVNPASVSVFYVRRFSDGDEGGRAGSVVTASIMSPSREYKYRLTPLLDQATAQTALAKLGDIVVSDMSGVIVWDDGWVVRNELG